ncbi:MAG: VWA domain-containing protein [Acidobacteriaceae bacterium]
MITVFQRSTSRTLASLALCFALPLCASALPAQSHGAKDKNQLPTIRQNPASAQTGNPQYTLKTNVNEVDLVFTVTDSKGRFVKNLKESDFALLDNHRAPAEVYSFTQQTQLPLRLGILVDTSNSIRGRFQFEQEAVNSFLLKVLRPSTDKAFVEGFDVTPNYVQGWTNDLSKLDDAIQQLNPGGGTALYDAVYSACRYKLLNAATGPFYVRRAIVLVSDGDDDQSHAYLSDAIRECQRAQTAIYAISTDIDPTPDEHGDDVLRKMADETGGRAFFPRSLTGLPISFTQVEDELRSQYALVYKPADFKANGEFRTIYLYSLDRRYKVHALKGYFTPKAE